MLQVDRSAAFIPLSCTYRGARLAAGIAEVALAAELLGLPEEQYAGFEHGYFPTLDVTAHMARVFGVSTNFLIGRKPATERERLANLIADGLARFEASLPFVATAAAVTKRLAPTLVRMRQAFECFATAADAAAHMGWNPMHYLAHEEGVRPLSAEQLVIYALEFEFRPDFALLGEVPTPLYEDADYPWWRRQSREEHLDPGGMVGPHFDWLRSGTSADTALYLPLIGYSDGQWTLRDKTFLLPRMLLPATAPYAGDTLYGIISGTEESVQVIVVDPTRSGAGSVHCRGDGGLGISYGGPAANVVDPTHHRPSRPHEFYCVGAYVVSVQTRATPEQDDQAVD
jgi:hypothetical protein